MENNKILLVDGMALLFRGFFATAFRGNFMKTSEGIPTNGIYQFLRYFLDAVDTYEPSHVICCWDMGSKTFRNEIYPPYKGNREAPPEELVPQFDLIKEVVEAFNIPNIGLENYEADDCIGTLARMYQDNHEVIILTGDQDMLQLVDQNINVSIMRKGQGNYELFTIDNFFEKKGIHPHQIVDMKALMGDSADNYPGVKGIGEKTAIRLMKEHHSIEGLLASMEQLTKGIRTKLETDLEMLHLSRKLAEIKCDVPVYCELETARKRFERTKIEPKLESLEFKNLDRMFAETVK
ncbi:5'-3' exonuclease [Oceanobacillus alkalisoli]|uniref:5'-3' exonuclease n=1 Tax=Oceanobacillus alkalisoli TaxID=2925113 RepID=UPI001EE3B759|nr:5'-3' exonuclease H3TH domain-containing protein [Oceanobacillus alkalisoli]MCG5105151.1 5'-3' exonuclease [Oceanobacillus alkalisoli]